MIGDREAVRLVPHLLEEEQRLGVTRDPNGLVPVREGDLLDLGMEDKIIDKSGSWISYGDIRLGQGRENAKQFLRENPALVDEITRKILEKRGLASASSPSADSNGEAPSQAKPEPSKKESPSRRQPVSTD